MHRNITSFSFKSLYIDNFEINIIRHYFCKFSMLYQDEAISMFIVLLALVVVHAEDCHVPRYPSFPSEFRWSHHGKLNNGYTCVQILEPSDPYT